MEDRSNMAEEAGAAFMLCELVPVLWSPRRHVYMFGLFTRYISGQGGLDLASSLITGLGKTSGQYCEGRGWWAVVFVPGLSPGVSFLLVEHELKARTCRVCLRVEELRLVIAPP